jgi:antitoxin component of RelBE/YafQ-DinJ toxin-antitoxin module
MKQDIHVRVSEEVMRGVRAYMDRYGLSLAAAITMLLQRGLKEES